MSETIRRTTLPNGLVLLAEPMVNVRSLAMTLRTPAGLAQQPAGADGVACVLAEHVLRGAGGRSAREHSDALDALGVQRSTDAGGRSLTLSATLLAEHRDAALPLLLDTLLRPNLDDDGFGPSRDLALQDLAGLDDDPQERAMIALSQHHQPAPLNRSPLGAQPDLEALTADGVRAYWQHACVPRGAVLAFAGRIDDWDRLVTHVTQLTADWTGTAAPVAPLDAPARATHHAEQESTQVHIALAYDSVPDTHELALTQRAAVAVLSGGMSGRLFTEVREKRGLCYSVYATYQASELRGDVLAYAGTTTARAQETLDVLHGELVRLADGVTDAEFERARIGMKSRLVMQGESTGARAAAIASDQVVHGRPRPLGERAAAVDALTADAVRSFVASRRPRDFTVVTVGPTPLLAAGR